MVIKLSEVELHILNLKMPDSESGWAVRKCLFSIASIEDKPPELMALLDSLMALERSLLNDASAPTIAHSRVRCLDKFKIFEACYPQNKTMIH